MKTATPLSAPTRARRSGKASLAIVLLLFPMLAVAVYTVGTQTLAARTRRAEAVVRVPAGLIADQDDAQTAILAVPNVRRAIDTCRLRLMADGDASDMGVKQVRDRMSVRVSADTPVASSTDLHIAYHFHGDASEATALVDQLAQQFAEPVRQRQTTDAERAYRDAALAASEAEANLAEAQRRLDAFVRQHLEPAQSARGETGVPKNDADQANQADDDARPQRAAIRRQLDRTRRYREQLLVDRTALHPAVQGVDAEIVDLEKRLAATSDEPVPATDDLSNELREMSDPLPQPLGEVGTRGDSADPLDQPPGRLTPPASQADSRTVARNRLKEFNALKRDVDDARQQYDWAVARRDEARQRQLDLPPVVVEAAQVSVDSAAAPGRPWRLGLVAMMVALSATAGVVMVAGGIADGAVFADAAQARATLSVPVLATLPPADHLGDGLRWRRAAGIALTVLCGLILLAASAGVVLALTGLVS